MTLSTPMIWVLSPIVIAGVSLVLQKRRILSLVLTSLTAFGLALLAAFFPEDLTLSLGPLTLVFDESLAVLGRQITLAYEIFPFIAFIFGMTGLWSLSGNLPGVPAVFSPTSLVITAALTAAMGVEPFLYAALLIQIAVLFSIPMLTSAGEEIYRGILRYLVLMTIAMPLILIAGWLLTGVVILPPESPLIGQSALVLGLGFALWLAVFPFHSWVPMVSQHSQPMVVSYLLFILPTTILVFGLNFINRYAFLRTSGEIFNIIRISGVVMILFGGILTTVQDNLKRGFGFSALVETGFSLLAVGSIAEGGLVWMLMLFPARAMGYYLWGYALTRLESHCGSLDITNLRGCARQFPMLTAGLLLAQLSVAGLPLLASFPVKIALLTQIMTAQTALGVWSFIGNLGLFIFTIRLLLNFVMPIDREPPRFWALTEKASEFLPVIIVVLVLVALGLIPQHIDIGLTNILTAFPQLQ
jgi:formate hydrogenlyase subunit 3/multisubunit Na+/H+ antiporter MnhD subunit